MNGTNGVYWLGADGNFWVKDASGVYNAGKGSTPEATNTRRFGLTNAAYIADPNPPKRTQQPQQPVSPAPTGGYAPAAPAEPVYPELNRAAVDNTNKVIDEIPGLLKAALEAEKTSYGNVISGYDAQQKAQQGTYDQSTVTNQQNYDSNYMDSIRAGIQGLGGLMNLLRGTGASGGTAQNMVYDTVGGITANDIRTGADTQKANQTALDNSLTTFLTDLGTKRTEAEDTYKNNVSALNRDSDTKLQKLYGKMAGYYGDAGNFDVRDRYMDRAGNLTADIAKNSKTTVSKYDRTPVAVNAPELTAFAGNSQPDAIAVPQDGQLGSGIFTMTKKKEQQNTPLVSPVGA